MVDADCNDGLYCNGAEVCTAGICGPGVPPSCDDGFSCTTDTCSEAQKQCVHAPSDAACDNGVFCDGAEKCDPANGAPVTGCAAGGGTPCDDGIACTTDACDEAGKKCSHAPVDVACDNGVFCDGAEFCNPLLGCMSMGAPSCDDGVACTDDFCDVASNGCKHVASDNHCSNNVYCDGAEKCDPVNGAPVTGCLAGAPIDCNDGVPCTIDACDEAQKKCDHAPDDAACSDGVFCDGAEVCDPATGCQAGLPPSCDDGLSCTADSCSEAQKQCVHAPSNAACDDGLYCNGTETCSPVGAPPSGCIPGQKVVCPSDNIACTDDVCDEATKACVHVADNANCAPGQFCVIQQNGCTSGKPCANSAQCQDGDLCNGVEVCAAGICQPGAPINCDDGVACTIDTCAPATGVCSHATNDAYCNDGLTCNGVETCNAQSGCVSTPAVNCDDGIACTADACVEPGGTCLHLPIDNLCSDGLLCNGVEVCDPQAGCKAGPAYVCPSDGIACTADVCDPALNKCVYLPNDSLCPCTQTCDPKQGGCGNFCSVKTCQGKVYQCGDCLDNDGDCKIDSADDQCLGPCDNTEDTFYGGIPGQNNSPCKSDCYFDADTGSGNDDCYWSHKCDPLEVPASYPPEGSQCAYNPNANIPGTGNTCSQLYSMQSAQCLGYCGPLTPNGCDCFGCCAIPGAPTTVWLGSENPPGVGSCNINTLNDPTKCKPCTQVQACLNPCDTCEICVGKPTIPPGCGQQSCPGGAQPCGLPGQPQCPAGSSCITGCCQVNPG